MCNNSSLKEVVEPRPFGSTMSHYSLILVPEITFWSFSSIYSWKWVESEWCCFMCIFRLRSFFSSLLQRVQGVGRSKCLALACLLALLRSANWLPHILHSNLENKKFSLRTHHRVQITKYMTNFCSDKKIIWNSYILKYKWI